MRTARRSGVSCWRRWGGPTSPSARRRSALTRQPLWSAILMARERAWRCRPRISSQCSDSGTSLKMETRQLDEVQH